MKRAGPAGWLLHDVKNRGVTAWIICGLLMAFYIILYFGQDYWTPESCTIDVHETCYSDGAVCMASEADAAVGECIREDAYERTEQWIYDRGTIHIDRLGWNLMERWDEDANDNGTIESWEHMGNRWTIYGILYTIAILLGGAWMIRKYRHNKYQLARTAVVMSVQTSFAFSIPILLKLFHQPEYYFSYIWPLKHSNLDPNTIAYYTTNYPKTAEIFILYSFFAALILTPVMTIIYGKRWYCSWVCGCGGLANTFGEPWRHLSSKSTRSWKIEKVTIHAVLVIAFVSTAIWMLGALMPESDMMQALSGKFRRYYGIFIVAALSGALGTAMYPIGGTRIWCRFACPMAALLGFIQKLGRYRIRVKKDMCISCGMCSTYCEMGIDVRAYAQANQSFTRASCVGCGLCAEVCPRGVLRLENALRRDPQELSMTSLIDESWKGSESQIDAANPTLS